MNPLKEFSPHYIWQHDIVTPWHHFLVTLSTQIDMWSAIAIAVLLFLRLFQWHKAGKAILPLIGVYAVLKVILP